MFLGVAMTEVLTRGLGMRSFTLSRNREADALVRQVVTELGREVSGWASEFGLAALVLGGGMAEAKAAPW